MATSQIGLGTLGLGHPLERGVLSHLQDVRAGQHRDSLSHLASRTSTGLHEDEEFRVPPLSHLVPKRLVGQLFGGCPT